MPTEPKEIAMRMRPAAVLGATLALSTSLLAACGGGGTSATDAYCKDLRAAKADFASLDSSTPDFDKLDGVIATFHKITKDAPAAVSDEWKTLDGGLSTLQKDLADAGLSLKDIGPISRGELPDGMTQDQLSALAPKLQATFSKLEDEKFQKASDKIEKHARSACHLDLSKS